MEADILKEFPEANIELTRLSGGIFDVIVDGTLIYSKQAEDGRFPHEGEINEKLRSL